MAYTTVNDPSAQFQTALYTGASTSVTVTNDGNANLQPDLIWIKRRNGTNDNNIFDTNRGLNNRQWTNLAGTSTTGTSVAALSDGFSTGTYWGDVNSNGNTFVGWQWKGNGGTNSTNNDGSITSTIQANTAAGFSIVKWTGTGSNGTVGHGLSKAPDCIFFKNYGAGENWTTYHSPLGNGGGMYLNLTNSFNTASSWYQDQSPTSDYFYVGTNSKTNGGTMVAYCFANTKGFSSFGSYSGSGGSAGPFVFLGFKPAFVMIKKVNSAEDWGVVDNKRSSTDGYNVIDRFLYANQNYAEATTQTPADLLSNGFKSRNSDGKWNTDGSEYIYMAFASSPFVSSAGVPTTAR